MPQAFVTGATGFVGQHLTRQLVESGWQVCVLCREGSDPGILKHLPIESRLGDITDADAMRAAIDRPFDAVFHTAADTSMWRGHAERQQAVNVEGTGHVLDAAMAAGVSRLVHTSSIVVWGFPDDVPIDEKTSRDEEAHWIGYCRTKTEAEELVRAADIDAVILNPSHIMGPLDHHNWMRMIRMVVQRNLPGIPPGAGSFADVREVARAHVRAFEQGRSGRNYVLGGENHSFETVIRIVGELSERPVRRPVVPAFALQALAQLKRAASRVTGREPDVTPESAAMVCHDTSCNSTRAVRELDYRITPLTRLLDDTLAWMREAGMIGGR